MYVLHACINSVRRLLYYRNFFVYCAGEIDPDESLFSYPEGLTAANFSYPDHIPAFLDEVVNSASEEVLDVCGDNLECIYDAAQTGDISIGLETMQADADNKIDQAISCMLL